MSLVFPGEVIPVPQLQTGKAIRLGPGLLHLSDTPNGEVVVATRAGILGSNKKGKELWVESNATRYSPAPQEHVVGIVTNRSADGYRVDIGGAHTAYLDGLAFEGASKRNKPNLKVGTIVFARISLAHKDMEPELECFDATTRKAEGFGELKAGYLVQCSLRMARSLYDPKFFLLDILGRRFPLEVVAGMNGRVWIKTAEPRHTIIIARCIEAVDQLSLDSEETRKLLTTLES